MGMFDFLKQKNEKEKAVVAKTPFRRPHETIVPEHQRIREEEAEIDAVKNDPEAHKRELFERKKQLMREKALAGTGKTVKKQLGVCIPNHAKTSQQRRNLPKKEISPFDKLRENYEKDTADFNREVEELSAQTSEEPYEYESDLGVESIEVKKEQKELMQKKASVSFSQPSEKERTLSDRRAALEREVKGVIASRTPFGNSNKNKELVSEAKSNWGKALPTFTKKPEPAQELEIDEIDESIEKVETYVPRFSKTAREKFTGEKDAVAQPSAHGTFAVTGVYPGGDTTIISGEVVAGKVNKRMSAQKGTSTIRINEIKKSMGQVNELIKGESGTIFARGTVNTIKYGDELEFS